MLARPFLLHSRNVRPVTSSGSTVADTFPVLLEHLSMPFKIIPSSEFIILKDFVIIAILMKVFSHIVTTVSPIFTLHK